MSVSALSSGPADPRGEPQVLKRVRRKSNQEREVLAAGRWGRPWCPLPPGGNKDPDLGFSVETFVETLTFFLDFVALHLLL